LANTGFQTVYNNIGLEHKHTAWSYALVIWNLGKWNSVKWNETRQIGTILHPFASHGFVSVSWASLLSSESEKALNQGSFVLLCFMLFAFSGLCLVLVMSVFNLSSVRIFQRIPTWTAYLCWCAINNLLTDSVQRSLVLMITVMCVCMCNTDRNGN